MATAQIRNLINTQIDKQIYKAVCLFDYLLNFLL